MTTAKPVRPRILEFVVIEAGAKARERTIAEIAGRLRRSKKRRVGLPAAVAELQSIASNPNERLKALGQRSMMRDPQSSIGATEGGKGRKKSTTRKAVEAMPEAPSRYATTTPEADAAVLALLERRDLIKDGVMRLGTLQIDPRAGVALLSEALAYSAPRSAAGAGRRVNTRGGVFYELLMPFHENVVAAETRVAIRETERIIRRRGAAAGLGKAEMDAQVDAAQETIRARMAGMSRVATEGQALSKAADGVSLMESGRIARDLWMIRLTGMRDVNGKLVADHFRALVSFEKNTTTLTPVGLGESKFQSGAGKIVPQMIETVARVSDGVTAANLPRTANVEVKWGSEVIAIIQSENAPPPAHFDDLAKKLAAEAETTQSFKATPITMVNEQGARDARKLVTAIMDELKIRKSQTKKAPSL